LLRGKSPTNMTNKVTAKALDRADRSQAVLVSCDARWHDLILGKAIKAILRKRVPKDAGVRWIYFYINAPHCVIAAKAIVKRVREMPTTEAVSRAKDLSLSRDEITAYSSGQRKIGAYELGRIVEAKRSLSLGWLRKKMAFFPPQSFLFLSTRAKSIIDAGACFE